MKLEHYCISEAFEREDWPAAIAALTAHFNIPMPADYRLDLLRHNGFQPEIEINHGSRIYSWRKSLGFESWPKWRKLYPENSIVVDIYAPPSAGPAGPKAGSPRS